MSRELVTWRKEGYTAIVTLQSGDNRFTPEFLAAFHKVLDDVENDDNIRALVTTNEGKIYSNGLPLQLFETMSGDEILQTTNKLTMLNRRILTFPMVTVAAINGHAFAAGAFLSLAHDYRVMRTGRGWFCLPEIKLKMFFRGGTLELGKAKLPPDQYTNCLLYGKRYTAEEAKRVGIIQDCCEVDQVLQRAVELANGIVSWQEEPYDREVLSKMKEDLYRDTVQVMIASTTKQQSKL